MHLGTSSDLRAAEAVLGLPAGRASPNGLSEAIGWDLLGGFTQKGFLRCPEKHPIRWAFLDCQSGAKSQQQIENSPRKTTSPLFIAGRVSYTSDLRELTVCPKSTGIHLDRVAP